MIILFAIFLTPLKWAVLGRQMGWGYGDGLEEKLKKKRGKRKRKGGDICRGGFSGGGGEEQSDREKEIGQRRGCWLVFLGERSPVVAKAGQVFSGITIYSFFVGSLIFQFLLVLFSVSSTLLVELLCFL